MIERPDPDALLAGPLGEWLARQQGLRDATKRKVLTRRIIAAIGVVIGMIVVPMLFGDTMGIRLWALMFFGVGGWAWAESAKRAVVTSIKTEMNQAIAQALDLSFSLTVTPGPEWERARAFQLTPGYDRSDFEDLWHGELGGLPFSAYEAHLERVEGSGKDRRVRTVFRGVLLSVRFTRRFRGVTLIDTQGKHSSWFSGEKEEVSLGGAPLRRCEMVNPAFEDRFTVWGSDPVEAHYLVHPEYVERLIAVEQAFRGEKIRALFMDGDLLIVLETENQFESGGLESDRDRALLAQTIDQFTALADLAKRLNEAPRGPVN